MPSLSARDMRLQRSVSCRPLQATSGASSSATSRPASQGTSMTEQAASGRHTPSAAMPASHNVARPAMETLLPKNSRRIGREDPSLLGLATRGLLDTEFFHAPIEGLAADAELTCRLRHHVTV